MFKPGERVRLTDYVEYECGDGCCVFRHDPGDEAIIVSVVFDAYEVYFPLCEGDRFTCLVAADQLEKLA